MTVNTSSQGLWTEWNHADALYDRHLGETYETDKRRYAGIGYRDDWDYEQPDLENHAFEWTSYFVSLITLADPIVRLRTTRSGPLKDMVRAVQFAQNRNIRETKFRTLAEKMFYDWAFRWSVAVTVPEANPSMKDLEDPLRRPVSHRVSPLNYRSDPTADDPDREKWRGDKITNISKEELKKRAAERPWEGWNVQVIEEMTEGTGMADQHRYERRNIASGYERGDVSYLRYWVPAGPGGEDTAKIQAYNSQGEPFTPREGDGYNGWVFYIPYGGPATDTGSSRDYLRRPHPFYGPRDGCYTVGGCYRVPDEKLPLSPISASKAQSDELNAVREAISARIRDYKKGWAVDAAAGDLTEILKDFEEHSVFAINSTEDLRKMLLEVEMGGATDMDFRHFVFLRESLERNSGMHEAQTGGMTPGVKATQVAVANQASMKRAGYQALQFIHFCEDIIKKEIWYFAKDESVGTRLGPEAAGVFKDPENGEVLEEAAWVGGDLDPDDLEVRIDLYSVGQTTEEQMRGDALEEDNLIYNVLPMVRQYPEYPWEDWIQRRGEMIGNPDLAKHFPVTQARKIGAMMLMAQMQGAQVELEAQGGTAQPRLGRDIAKGGQFSPVGFAKSGLGGMIGSAQGASQAPGMNVQPKLLSGGQ